jgi:DNA ligase (NAD+)
MASLIENMGGKIGTSVSKNTDYLIVLDQSVLDNMTEKIKKAVELGITILTRDKLEKMLS